MKRLLIILSSCCCCFISFCQAKGQHIQSPIERKIDSLTVLVSEIDNKLKDGTKQTVVKVDSLQTIIDSLKSKSNNSGIWIPAIIAFLAVAFSSLISYRIAVKQLRKQTETGEIERGTQISIAQDQLQVSREQIAETTKMSLAQVRANNISQARIKWIQDLRDILCEYINEVAIISYEIKDIIEVKKDSEEDLEHRYKAVYDKVNNMSGLSAKIMLFLNPKDPDHRELEKLIRKFMQITLGYESILDEFELNDTWNRVLEMSKKILKDTWEQAKTEGQV